MSGVVWAFNVNFYMCQHLLDSKSGGAGAGAGGGSMETQGRGDPGSQLPTQEGEGRGEHGDSPLERGAGRGDKLVT